MKNKEKALMSIIIFLISIVFVALMSVQFKTIDKTNITEIENMQEAELRTEIANWKTKYIEIIDKANSNNQKISEYQNKIDNNQQANELLNAELLETNMLTGKAGVVGEGIVITLQDTSEGIIESDDLVDLINELRYAGAEAISINDQRVIFNSYVVSVGSKYISVGGSRVTSPYIVKAIGNQSYLSSTLNLKNSGYVDRYNSSGKSIAVSLDSNIEIPAYKGEIQFKNID